MTIYIEGISTLENSSSPVVRYRIHEAVGKPFLPFREVSESLTAPHTARELARAFTLATARTNPDKEITPVSLANAVFHLYRASTSGVSGNPYERGCLVLAHKTGMCKYTRYGSPISVSKLVMNLSTEFMLARAQGTSVADAIEGLVKKCRFVLDQIAAAKSGKTAALHP